MYFANCTCLHLWCFCTCTCIGFISVPVLIMILVSKIIPGLLCLIMAYLDARINQDKVSIASLVSEELGALFQLLAMLRGPGDRPSKRDYLPINMALRQPSVAIQPMIALDDDYWRVSTTSLRNRNTNILKNAVQSNYSIGCNLVSHKFDGRIAKADNCRDMMKDLPYGTVPTTDTTSSGYITATSPKVLLEDNDHEVPKYGVSYLAEGELKSKAKSGISGYGHSEYPVLIGNTVVVYGTKAFASLPQHSEYITSYAVLIGNTVRVYDTKMYAALPLHNKCMIKERVKDASGNTRVKMSLKTLQSRLHVGIAKM